MASCCAVYVPMCGSATSYGTRIGREVEYIRQIIGNIEIWLFESPIWVLAVVWILAINWAKIGNITFFAQCREGKIITCPAKLAIVWHLFGGKMTDPASDLKRHGGCCSFIFVIGNLLPARWQ